MQITGIWGVGVGYRSREATQPQANCKLLIRVCPLVYKGTPAWEAEGENILASSAVAFRPRARLPVSVLGTLHSDFTIHILRTPCLQLNRMQQLLVAGVFGLLVSPGVPLPHRMPACQGSATSGDTGRSQLGLRIAAGGRRPLAGPNTGAEAKIHRCVSKQDARPLSAILPLAGPAAPGH